MWVQHSLPHDEVRFPVTLEHRAAGLLHRHLPCLVLGGQAEEAAEHPLVLGQLEGGLDGEAGLEEGRLGGEDGRPHLLSAKRLDVDGAESTETLATAQLISAEQLWQHAENNLRT